MKLKPLFLGLACAWMATLSPAHADAADPVDPDRLKPFLPVAWGGLERRSVEGKKSKTMTGPRSEVEGYYKAGFNGPGRLELIITLSDEGAEGAKFAKAYGYDYLKKDVTNDSQKTLVIDGRRLLMTESTKTSFMLETLVGDRFGFRLSCVNATEAQCTGALAKINLAGLGQLKP